MDVLCPVLNEINFLFFFFGAYCMAYACCFTVRRGRPRLLNCFGCILFDTQDSIDNNIIYHLEKYLFLFCFFFSIHFSSLRVIVVNILLTDHILIVFHVEQLISCNSNLFFLQIEIIH